jgi:acetyl-CoA/propionyl-CoA carboxylase, biotin carboxylase, biotin carboxyl carrier protein
MFSKILVANRGEIAVRIARTCEEMAVGSVAVFSDADAGAAHVRRARESVRLPGTAPAETYLNIPRIVAAALDMGAEAVHPGYGFLAENASFARAVMDAGLVWIGPPPEVIDAVGDKIAARRIAVDAGVPVVPGVLDPIEDPEEVSLFGREHGYPLAVKAAGGGGGRGLKIARRPEDVADAFAAARREARAYFGSSDVYVERYLDAPKHLEVQILADGAHEPLWLGVRDCSIQRRHQKLIEETPPPKWQERARDMGEAAVRLATACGYVNAGTVEMLVDADGSFYFLEVNARLQVEHTVTEEVYGVDLVRLQLLVAAGEAVGLEQADLTERGHAIECRVNAEDPARGFAPTPGTITRYAAPSGRGVRVDSGYEEGDEVPAAYDSLIAKVIACGDTRAAARQRMVAALREFEVDGIHTTIPAHLVLLDEPSFVRGDHTTATVEEGVLDSLVRDAPSETHDVLLVDGRPVRLWNPAMASSAAAAIHGGPGSGRILAPMQGTIVKVLVEVGREVASGDALFVLEAMKMESAITAPVAGTVTEVHAGRGETVGAGALLVVILT